MHGEEVALRECLLINPDIPMLETMLGQLTQPTWRESQSSGRVELIKRDENETSPDMYDSIALTFAQDSVHGLVNRHLLRQRSDEDEESSAVFSAFAA